jgi:hypothetical protein
LYRLLKAVVAMAVHPPVAVWLEANKADWVGLVDWLKRESLKMSLGGNSYQQTRSKEKENTLGALARLAGLSVKAVLKVPKGKKGRVYDGCVINNSGIAPPSPLRLLLVYQV